MAGMALDYKMIQARKCSTTKNNTDEQRYKEGDLVYLFSIGFVITNKYEKFKQDCIGQLVTESLDSTHYKLSDLSDHVLHVKYHINRMMPAHMLAPQGHMTTQSQFCVAL